MCRSPHRAASEADRGKFPLSKVAHGELFTLEAQIATHDIRSAFGSAPAVAPVSNRNHHERARRQAVLAASQAIGAFVIEDDYDGEIIYDRPPVAALAALDKDSRVFTPDPPAVSRAP